MRYFIFIIISIILFSCSKGKEETQNRNITTPFNTIQAFDKVYVYFTQDTTVNLPIVRVETGSNLMKKVTTEVVDSVLQIKNSNSFIYDSVKVFVTAPHVTYIIQDGVGHIYSTNTINEKNLDYNIRNSGNVYLKLNISQTVTGHVFGIGDAYLSGKTSNHLVNIKGESFLYAHDLNTDYCFIDYYSTGEAHVNIKGQLDAVIEYTGNIYYSGNGVINLISDIGKGKLIRE